MSPSPLSLTSLIHLSHLVDYKQASYSSQYLIFASSFPSISSIAVIMSSNASTPTTSADQTKLTVPSVNALPAAQDSGNLSRTSSISTQSDVSPCPSLFDKPDDEVSSGNVTENDTPPESPGRTSTKLCADSSAPIMKGQAPDITVSTVDSTQQAKEAVTGDRKSKSGKGLMRSVSVMIMQLAKGSYTSSSRMLKRTGPPSSLRLPSTHESGYGTSPPQLERNLSDILEVSREGSQTSQPPSEHPDGLPSTSGTAWDTSIRVTPPAPSQQPMTCPSAPLIRPAQLPKDTMDAMARDDDISPLTLSSPMNIFRGNVVGRIATRASTVDTYNPYFPPIDGQVQSLF